MTPIILLAFANDKRNTGAGYLRGLTVERNAIRDALMKAEENGLCQVLVEPDASVDRIFDIFQNNTYRDRIAIFHYGGHADSYSLLLESASGGTAAAHSEGLVAFLSKQKSLKLIFLNGCSSQHQSEDLIAAGLPAVIGTSQSINDTIATGLATRFYKGLSAGMAIERSWTDAVDQIKTETGTENSKELYHEGILGAPGEQQFPWQLYTGEGGVRSKAWNLPEAANQPLFGLELPNSYYRKLPSTPYAGLRSSNREEAGIFFGRGQDIRRLHTQLGREQPVIILSGKKGVGKTSLLAAGLAPRLESDYVTSMCTIENKNLSESLSDTLDKVRESQGMEKLPPKDKNDLEEKIAEVRKIISSVSGFPEILLENELNRLIHLSGMERLTYKEQWLSIEENTGKPLVILLDEVPSDPVDWKALLEIMTSIFEREKSPKGKLVLSIDEENHLPFCEMLQTAGFPYSDVFLQPLTWDGLNEAITGISLSPVTKEFYRLHIENTPSNNLSVALCGDLSDGDTTLVAPYLQVILSDFWNSAVKGNAQAPSFTMRMYQQEILSGDIMDRFLTNQLRLLHDWDAEPVLSGLVLDLLYLHTSALGKSNILEAGKRMETYGDRRESVNALIRKCKDLFLLTSAHSDGTNLGHHLLAPVVIRHYSISLSPGQQAARILNSKTSKKEEPGKMAWLNEVDLEIVEKGMQGMRSLNTEEKALLEFSRIKKNQAQQERKRNRVIRGVLVTVVGIFAILAAWQWHVAHQRYLYSRSGELAFTAREVLKEDNTIAMNIARHGYAALGPASPPLVMQIMSDIFHTQDEMPFYASDFPHTEKVFTAVFSPDGQFVLTASEDGFAKLWNLKGKEILSLPHEIEVTSAAFSPNGQQFLTLTRTHVSLWEKNGKLTDRDSIPETMTSLDSFSTDGLKIIRNPGPEDVTGYYSTVVQLRQDDRVVISSAAENRILVVHNSTCSLFDGNGTLLKDSVSSSVFNAAFSKDGKQFVTVSPDSVASRITVWNENADSIYSFRCRGTEVGAVFSPDGLAILTSSNDFTAKLWDFSNPFLHRFPQQTQGVNTVDFFPDGSRYLTASFDSTARIWDGSGKLIDVLKHRDIVISAVFAPDGKNIVTASRDSTAMIWNPVEKIVIALQHQDEVTGAVVSHDGQFVLTSSLDSLARLWKPDGTLVQTFRHGGEVSWTGFSPDDKFILSVSSDNAATLWDIKGNTLQVFKHPAKVISAGFSRDGQYLLTSCADSLVRQWTVEGNLVRTFQHQEKPKIALFSPDGTHIISGGRLLKIWNTNGMAEDSLPHTEIVSSVSISPDGKLILTTCFDHHAYLWNFSGELLASYRKHTEKINFGCFTADGKYILTAADDGYVYRWKTPQAIYDGLESSGIYQLSKKEEEVFGIRR